VSSNKSHPLRCPIVDECRKQTSYAYEVRTINDVRDQVILDKTEWDYVTNCPHKMQEGLGDDRLFDDDFWYHYLKCPTFSKWFWEQAAKEQRGGTYGRRRFIH